ncbi:MAG: Tm-1-like ATP-binding domain-containing protein [Solirubrobacterales bacterium]|nr:Tm-1-like ATP-binding domain-containing protein [Solirubrobacterales bacterium]
MPASPVIALIGTLDTKGEEIAYVRDRLRALGARPVVIDTGILGEPAGAGNRLCLTRLADPAAQFVERM